MDQGFPGQHTTTTTVTTTTTTTQPNIRFDPSYARTLPGILKIVQVVSVTHIHPSLVIYNFTVILLSDLREVLLVFDLIVTCK